MFTRGLRFCAIESWRCIDSLASAICLYIRIDIRIKYDDTDSKSAGYASKKLRAYLEGYKFIAFTDHLERYVHENDGTIIMLRLYFPYYLDKTTLLYIK